jgi:hypothetical protein
LAKLFAKNNTTDSNTLDLMETIELDSNNTNSPTKKQNNKTLEHLKKFYNLTKSTSESTSVLENVENDELGDENDEDNEREDDGEMKEMWLSENPKLEKNLKVKLIITDMNSDSEIRQSLRTVVSPVLSKLKFLPKYGIFHTCLVIGPFKLEWNNSALCIPRVIKSKASLLALDIKEIATVGEFKTTVDILAEVITKWNNTMKYSEAHSTAKKGNCQDFVLDVLKALNIALDLSGPVEAYLKDMKKHGQCRMKFPLDDTFKEHFQIKEQSLQFETHRELDEFVNRCIVLDPNFGKSNFVQEYQLLKGFDRAFWMRHLEQLSREESKRDTNHAAFEPLTESENTIDLETFEERIQERCVCPFDDPRNTVSFLDKSNDGGNKTTT